jgi:hypothetical protein
MAAAQSFLERHEITIHAEDAPPPCHDMAAAPFPPPILQQLLSRFTEPTAVQGASWPLGIAGRDVLAIAKTGSGKTLAFLLPAIMRCVAERKAYPADLSPPAPFCLVMAPTRELALQTTEQARLFGAALGVRAVAVYGGSPKWGQARDLESGCEIVVATPGRMLDMLDLASSSGFGTGGKGGSGKGGGGNGGGNGGGKGGGGKGGGGKGGGKGGGGKGGGKGGSYSGYSSGDGPCCSLSRCVVLVLDEADRMLDMGFERDVHTIASCVASSSRQVLLYTATWPPAVQRVADALLGPRHVRVTVGAVGERLVANPSVRQHVRIVAPKDKWATFLELVRATATAPRPAHTCICMRTLQPSCANPGLVHPTPLCDCAVALGRSSRTRRCPRYAPPKEPRLQFRLQSSSPRQRSNESSWAGPRCRMRRRRRSNRRRPCRRRSAC